MKFLILTGPLFPQRGNNANLIIKIAQELSKEGEVRFMTLCDFDGVKELDGFGVYCVKMKSPDIATRVRAKLYDPNGNGDYIQAMALERKVNEVKKKYNFDTLISTLYPYYCAYVGARFKEAKSVTYIMDPPGELNDMDSTKFTRDNVSTIIEKSDLVLTTPFIKQALEERGYNTDKIETVGFPMICDNKPSAENEIKFSPDKINLLFCGWLYGGIRSPKYFLKLVEKLDERFCVYFMGKECDQLFERFDLNTKAEVIALPQQPYDVALSAMAQADILINIGNSVPVHMPSKTLEYINTGKPFVNFYKFRDCPTLHYTNRYPLCLNLYEGDDDIDAAFEKFSEFCVSKKGNTISREVVKEEFCDCTPEYIAGKILEGLGK